MLQIAIPGFGTLELRHLVLDYNGTLARDGILLPGVAERLQALAPVLEIHVITADTFGNVQAQLQGLPCRVQVLPPGGQAAAKLAFVESLGARGCVALGNGRNDRLMLAAAALGIAVLQEEGASSATLMAAPVVAPCIQDALDLLIHPLRLVATLRD